MAKSTTTAPQAPLVSDVVKEPIIETGTASEAAAVESNQSLITAATQIPVMRNVDDVFNRVINTRKAITAITFKRTLTRPLTSISHCKEIMVTVTQEMYAYELPTKGRSDKMQPATILEGTDAESGEEILLILNAMMKSALERAGAPLIGRTFAFREQGVRADKNYRVVDVVEVEVS